MKYQSMNLPEKEIIDSVIDKLVENTEVNYIAWERMDEPDKTYNSYQTTAKIYMGYGGVGSHYSVKVTFGLGERPSTLFIEGMSFSLNQEQKKKLKEAIYTQQDDRKDEAKQRILYLLQEWSKK